jgi:hypothetical protein
VLLLWAFDKRNKQRVTDNKNTFLIKNWFLIIVSTPFSCQNREKREGKSILPETQ